MTRQRRDSNRLFGLGDHREVLIVALMAVLCAGCANMPNERQPGTLPESLPQDEYVAFDDEGNPTHVCRPTDPQTLTCRIPFGVDEETKMEGPLQQDGIRVVTSSLHAAESTDPPPLEVVAQESTHQVEVRITRDHIYVNDKKVADLVNGRVPAEQKVGGEWSLLIAPLRDALSDIAAEYDKAPEYIVVADRATDYVVITEIAYTLSNSSMVTETMPFAVISERHEVPLYCEASETGANERICHAVSESGASDERVETIELITVGNAVNNVPRFDPAAGIFEDFCDKQHLQEVISDASPRIRACWEEHIEDNSNLAGKVLVKFKIMPDGQVGSSSIEDSTLDNPDVEQCINDHIQTLKFNETNGGICVILYPFVVGERDK